MAVKNYGQSNIFAGLFATFWVLLAIVSAAYLFHIVTTPAASQTETAQVTAPVAAQPDDVPTAATPAPPAPPPLSEEQAKEILDADAAKDKEISDLKTQVASLSQQLSDLDARLKPIEKIVGPVAALPPSASVTTSPPAPQLPVPEAVRPPEPVKPEPKGKAAKDQAKAAKVAEQAKAESKEPAKPEAKTAEAAPEPAKPIEKPAEVKAPEAAEKTADAKPAEPKPAETSLEAQAPEKPIEPKQAEKREEPKPGGKPAEVASASPNTDIDEGAAAAPAPEAEKASGAGEGGTETAALTPAIPIPPGTTRFGIEIGSVDKQEALRPLWKDLLNNHAALVAGLQPRRVLAPDKKWRLIAGPFPNVAEATQACGLFKKANLPCEATVFAGDGF